ncbi:hypothetical protein Csa_015660 [Cucumis sativus]|uniref:Uncharacterized protein n=1 Tax=Cucumis sativus TaxID=3659 RepID=A0A0A0K6A5_CUCSA|nr:hypothetical protein Csa_015660 [Cucumis sativus]
MDKPEPNRKPVRTGSPTHLHRNTIIRFPSTLPCCISTFLHPFASELSQSPSAAVAGRPSTFAVEIGFYWISTGRPLLSLSFVVTSSFCDCGFWVFIG